MAASFQPLVAQLDLMSDLMSDSLCTVDEGDEVPEGIHFYLIVGALQDLMPLL